MLTFWQRVRNLLKEDLNQSWLCNEIGVSSGTFSNWISNDRYPGVDKAQAIASALGVSVEFLVSGGAQESAVSLARPTGGPRRVDVSELNPDGPIQGVPFYNVSATAHIAGSFLDVIEAPSFYIDFEPFNDCDAYIPVAGDSMHPTFCDGEFIAIRRMRNCNIILWGEPYVVVTSPDANDLRVLKTVHAHKDDSKLILRSTNPEYGGDTVIDKVDIVGLFLVKGKISRRHL